LSIRLVHWAKDAVAWQPYGLAPVTYFAKLSFIRQTELVRIGTRQVAATQMLKHRTISTKVALQGGWLMLGRQMDAMFGRHCKRDSNV